MPDSHHLAAILFTDIVGYTALMGEDERKAFDLLKVNRQLQKPLIEKFGGIWIKEMGDGILSVFSSATNAAACACSIIKSCDHITGLQLRAGIHLGDIVTENDDVFGDGVNIASRLQALAPVNGIWISESVYHIILNKKGLQAHYVKEEHLKNVRDPMRIYQIDTGSFIEEEFHLREPEVVSVKKTHREQISKPGNKISFFRRPMMIGLLALLIVLIPSTYFLVSNWMQKIKARDSWIPEIQQIVSRNFIEYPKAFLLAQKAEKLVPGDPVLKQLWSRLSTRLSIKTSPVGANVFWKDQYDTTGDWNYMGKTPFREARVPKGSVRIKIEKPGYTTIFTPIIWNRGFEITLDSVGKMPNNMVKVIGSNARMLIVGLIQYGDEGGANEYVPEFLMGKYEVTNSEYKKFVDAGGYLKKEYWDYPIFSKKGEISWEKAMALFRDETGKPGPSNWMVGTYPDGKENYPVTGVSWYEAVAYAKFAGKELPTVFHWSQVANTIDTWTIIPRSNFGGMGPISVGSKDNMSFWGVYDIAGNAREWCVNESQIKGNHYILGGGWNDPNYAYNDAYTQSGIDRSVTNGFRCMKLLPGDSRFAQLSRPLALDHRDYSTEKPVNDQAYEIYLRQFNYDHKALNPKVELVIDSADIKIEKIDLDAAYNKERLSLYLYIPKSAKPPYQTIMYFPGSGDLVERKFDFNSIFRFGPAFLMKTGRVLAYPILKSTFERGDGQYSDLQNETVDYKDHVIWWVQDFGRCMDYLDNRQDIAHDGYGFFGWSWGSAIGPIVCAVDSRIKAAVYQVGGLMQQKTLGEVDPLNFLPRVKIPVLMLNGKNDTFFPYESSQKPMFRLLGSGDKFKEMKVYEGGHLVPYSELIRESTSWYDKYLGPAK